MLPSLPANLGSSEWGIIPTIKILICSGRVMAKSKSKIVVSVESILADHQPEIRELVEHLRVVIRRTVPEATETAHAVWHSIGYTHPRGGYFCGIFPLRERIDLAFEFGVLLSDPDRLLEGNGKQVRYLRYRKTGDIDEAVLVRFLKAAIDLPERRDVKLALVRSAAKPVQDQ